MPRSNETLLRFGAIVLPMVLVAAAAHSALKPQANGVAVPSGIPTAEEFASLGKYLRAVPAQGVPVLTSAERVRADSYDPFFSADLLASAPVVSGPIAPVRDRYVVTAILISRDKRVAVIDESLVSVGSVLAGGIRVIAIENDHVEIVGPSGTRRMLTIKDTNGP